MHYLSWTFWILFNTSADDKQVQTQHGISTVKSGFNDITLNSFKENTDYSSEETHNKCEL